MLDKWKPRQKPGMSCKNMIKFLNENEDFTELVPILERLDTNKGIYLHPYLSSSYFDCIPDVIKH